MRNSHPYLVSIMTFLVFNTCAKDNILASKVGLYHSVPSPESFQPDSNPDTLLTKKLKSCFYFTHQMIVSILLSLKISQVDSLSKLYNTYSLSCVQKSVLCMLLVFSESVPCIIILQPTFFKLSMSSLFSSTQGPMLIWYSLEDYLFMLQIIFITPF